MNLKLPRIRWSLGLAVVGAAFGALLVPALQFLHAAIDHDVLIGVSMALLGLGIGWGLGRKLERLRALSTTDALTGLSTRRAFNERLVGEVNRGARYRAPLAVLAIDVDHLKTINDEMGHRYGDEALRRVATCLQLDRRASDVAARIGGDEFALLLPETTATEALAVVDRITERLSASAAPLFKELSVSVGVTQLDAKKPRSIQDLLEEADRALYVAKVAGGGRAVLAPVSADPELATHRTHSDHVPAAFIREQAALSEEAIWWD